MHDPLAYSPSAKSAPAPPESADTPGAAEARAEPDSLVPAQEFPSTASYQAAADRRGTDGAGPAIPGYEVLGLLGQGGMGVVYRARQVALKRLVALKMISSGSQAGEAELARFRLEAEAVARLQHPNIVQVFEIGEWRPQGASTSLPYLAR
jgi:serine/threonine protein kinase